MVILGRFLAFLSPLFCLSIHNNCPTHVFGLWITGWQLGPQESSVTQLLQYSQYITYNYSKSKLFSTIFEDAQKSTVKLNFWYKKPWHLKLKLTITKSDIRTIIQALFLPWHHVVQWKSTYNELWYCSCMHYTIYTVRDMSVHMNLPNYIWRLCSPDNTDDTFSWHPPSFH